MEQRSTVTVRLPEVMERAVRLPKAAKEIVDDEEDKALVGRRRQPKGIKWRGGENEIYLKGDKQEMVGSGNDRHVSVGHSQRVNRAPVKGAGQRERADDVPPCSRLLRARN